MFKPTDTLTLGLTYTGSVDLGMSGGRYISDQTAAGLGKVTYRDVQVEGLNLPQELGLGAAVRFKPKLLIATAVKWINWSSALKTSTLTVTNPDNPAAPAALVSMSSLD
jgi:long-chain fatty acid transport protein